MYLTTKLIPFLCFLPDCGILLTGDARPVATVRHRFLPGTATRFSCSARLNRSRGTTTLHHPFNSGRSDSKPTQSAHLFQSDRSSNVRFVPVDVRQIDAGRWRDMWICRGIGQTGHFLENWSLTSGQRECVTWPYVTHTTTGSSLGQIENEIIRANFSSFALAEEWLIRPNRGEEIVKLFPKSSFWETISREIVLKQFDPRSQGSVITYQFFTIFSSYENKIQVF